MNYAWALTVRFVQVRDLDLWVNLFNVLPSLLSLLASVLGVWMHWTQVSRNLSTGAALFRIPTAFRFCIVNLSCSSPYAADAIGSAQNRQQQ
jgi:hypothetical protein